MPQHLLAPRHGQHKPTCWQRYAPAPAHRSQGHNNSAREEAKERKSQNVPSSSSAVPRKKYVILPTPASSRYALIISKKTAVTQGPLTPRRSLQLLFAAVPCCWNCLTFLSRSLYHDVYYHCINGLLEVLAYTSHEREGGNSS